MRGHRLVTVQPVITAADSKSEERATPKYNSYSVLYCADTPYYLAVLQLIFCVILDQRTTCVQETDCQVGVTPYQLQDTLTYVYTFSQLLLLSGALSFTI
ncbi:hypothetical protein EB796_005962 [Bugula neritina]|uniref:Uncharacterized protein n=1 Tax=Bugula neritina TaxID=10212 RepID=A0A7J7KDV7_BUGNE|nr:hypothetical protein EB796_005962 [Bugula neritina]